MKRALLEQVENLRDWLSVVLRRHQTIPAGQLSDDLGLGLIE